MLEKIDLGQKLEQPDYKERLKRLQSAVHGLGYQVYRQQRPCVMVFEGWDASGKGGAIKRLTEKLDPRGFVVWPIAAPTGEDKARHYMYRFWRRLPETGQIALFDRSWYGRVLVERVEGYCAEAAWQRAYSEINQFERELHEFGCLIFKFWLHISQAEQLRRFNARKRTPYKKWKLTEDDWRNRGKWQDYEQAAEDMLLKTSTPYAPWTIVEADDKRFARIKVLETVVSRLTQELED